MSEEAKIRKGRGKCNREEVLQLAMQEFQGSEYEDIQMNILAAKLGVSNGTIFYHFPTKQTLFFEIYNRYYMSSLEDNMKELLKYRQMTPVIFKEYLLTITENMFERHFNMVRLLKIHSMVLDKGVNLDKVKPCLEKSMKAFGEYIEELHNKNAYFDKQELVRILNARSAMIIGYFYMFMEPKIVDTDWNAEKRQVQKIVFKHKMLETLALYLDGVVAKHV